MVLAFDLQGKCIILRRTALVLRSLRRFGSDDVAVGDGFAQRIDQHIKIGFERLIVEGDMALVKTDGADVDHPARGFSVRIFRVKLERPVGAAIGQTLQLGIGFGQVDARNHHALRQQCQRRDTQLNAFERDHLLLFRPVRVAQAQILSDHVRPRHPGAPAALVRLALPDHREVAINSKRSVQFFRDFGVERRFDPVPVEEHDDQHQHGQ
ncbi:hypothetical protein D3C81_1303160 [compost metagenome]